MAFSSSFAPADNMDVAGLTEYEPEVTIAPRPRRKPTDSKEEEEANKPAFIRPIGVEHLDQPSPKPPSRVVVVAVDGSKESMNALNWALGSVVQAGDELILLSVLELPPPSETGMGMHAALAQIHNVYESVKEEEKKECQAVLKKAAQLVKEKQQPGIHTRRLLIMGNDAKESICTYTEQHPCDLLVLGSRGLGAVARFFMGSVSDYCVHNCRCSVLIAR